METANERNSLKVDEKLLSALVVDDNATLRTVHQIHLSKRGVSTMAVENGKEAVDLCSSGNYFDIIIMDMEMPVMDGIEATKQLREMAVRSVIVGATASSCSSDIENFKKAGLDKCYAKPLSGDMFDEMLHSLNNNSTMLQDK